MAGLNVQSWGEKCRDRLVDAVFAAASELRRPEGPNVHRSRRNLKKARALVKLLQGGPGGHEARAAAAVLDRARRGLGPARDLDIIAAQLPHYSEGLAPETQADLLERLALHKADLAQEPSDDPLHVAADLEALGHHFRNEAWASATPKNLASSVATTFARIGKRGRRAFAHESAEDLHALRSPVVVARYQLDALAEAWPRLFAALSGECEKLRDDLGEFQDLTILSGFVTGIGNPATQDLEARGSERRAVLIAKARRRYDRLMSEGHGLDKRIRHLLELPQRAPDSAGPSAAGDAGEDEKASETSDGHA